MEIKRRGRPPKNQQLEEHEADVVLESNQKVKRVQFHNGVQLGNIVRNSLDDKKDNADIELCPHGVKVHMRDTDRFFIVPIGILVGIELYPPHIF